MRKQTRDNIKNAVKQYRNPKNSQFIKKLPKAADNLVQKRKKKQKRTM